ncbi:NADP-dependent glutamate dehydrogenase [Savitreella phatthalungensis]
MSNKPSEPEFEQALAEIANTIKSSSLFSKRPELEKALEVLAIPERIVQFRVTWEDDSGKMRVNTGYRVQQSSALGPYKGGLRFHPSVNLSILKFLALEQALKNALTGLSMGAGKGGLDIDPSTMSNSEIRRACESFMRELSRHIGADTDVPAGDIGVGGREVGFLFGAYRRMQNKWEGILTGKGAEWGGSYIRPEATGYGLIYYVEHMIKYASGGKESFDGKTVALSGSGNVAQYAALKAIELGAKVVSLSDSKGSVICQAGFTPADIQQIADLKLQKKSLDHWLSSTSADKAKYVYKAGERPWTHVKVDIALPSATQNEVSGAEAQALVDGGCLFIAEGSNMGCTQEAIDVFEAVREKATGKSGAVFYAPGKAANAGGVAVSGLEMAQNSSRVRWTSEEVDAKLAGIMEQCFTQCVEAAEQYAPGTKDGLPSLVTGANLAGFIRVADALQAQGDWW